jgi:DNA-binding XRE family transcriptional regulator
MTAKKLRALRRSKDITGHDMSKLLGYKSIATYYKKENGQSKFSLEEALLISKNFGTTVEELFAEDDVEGVAGDEEASASE